MNAVEMANAVCNKIHLGSELSVQSKKGATHEKIKTCVVGFYPSFILTENENGFAECFLYYDVWAMLNGGAALEERDDE